MCGAERCVPFDGGAPLYSDNFHLTIAGAEKFTQGFAADLAWAFGDAKAAGSGEAAPANQEFGR
jgi:SGNH domain-containing protein